MIIIIVLGSGDGCSGDSCHSTTISCILLMLVMVVVVLVVSSVIVIMIVVMMVMTVMIPATQVCRGAAWVKHTLVTCTGHLRQVLRAATTQVAPG